MCSWGIVHYDRAAAVIASLFDGNAIQGFSAEPFNGWIENFFRFNAVEHSRRLNGVFDQALIPQIARILQTSESDLTRVWQLSANEEYLARHANDARNTHESLDLMYRACSTAALLRGRYHDNYARLANLQVVHHPVRDPFLPVIQEDGSSRFEASNTLHTMASALVSYSARDKKLDQRITSWSELTLQARRLAAQGRLDLDLKSTDDVAVDTAIENLRKLDLRGVSKQFEAGLEVGVSIGFGAVTSFALDPWAGFAATSAASAAMRLPWARSVVGQIKKPRKFQLKRLSESPAGRIRRRKRSDPGSW